MRLVELPRGEFSGPVWVNPALVAWVKELPDYEPGASEIHFTGSDSWVRSSLSVADLLVALEADS